MFLCGNYDNVVEKHSHTMKNFNLMKGNGR